MRSGDWRTFPALAGRTLHSFVCVVVAIVYLQFNKYEWLIVAGWRSGQQNAVHCQCHRTLWYIKNFIYSFFLLSHVSFFFLKQNKKTKTIVDDHFAKALGETWLKLQSETKEKEASTDSQPGSPLPSSSQRQGLLLTWGAVEQKKKIKDFYQFPQSMDHETYLNGRERENFNVCGCVN